jgi:GTPase SAR1 family protein
MPFFIPIVLGGIAVSAYVAWKLRRKHYRLAVLGVSLSGKTTLINSWRGDWVDDPGRTQAAVRHSRVKLTVDGFRLSFDNLTDVSGHSFAWPEWTDRVNESRYVLYLVDARQLARQAAYGFDKDWYRLEDDAGLIRNVLATANAYLCIIVVTHTDQDYRTTEYDAQTYEDVVRKQLDPIVLRLGGDGQVRLVTGSLVDQASADAVTSKIMAHILNQEKNRK